MSGRIFVSSTEEVVLNVGDRERVWIGDMRAFFRDLRGGPFRVVRSEHVIEMLLTEGMPMEVGFEVGEPLYKFGNGHLQGTTCETVKDVREQPARRVFVESEDVVVEMLCRVVGDELLVTVWEYPQD